MYHFSCRNGVRINRYGVGGGEEDQIIIAVAGHGKHRKPEVQKGGEFIAQWESIVVDRSDLTLQRCV